MQFVAHQGCLDAQYAASIPQLRPTRDSRSLGCISSAFDALRMRGTCAPQDVYGSTPSGRIPVQAMRAKKYNAAVR
jgi:hypothetical protein